ncbi:MAG: hypothetical protein L0212_00765 [Acidobacteria bacterium]|nr:hypothetical protein [Acidobacteriota bacterium]
MPNHVLKDGVLTSDKLAACRLSAPPESWWAPTPGDLARLAYPWCLLPLYDDWGCFELSLPLVRIRCFSRFEAVPSVEQLGVLFQLWNHHGLLFVWEERGKGWAYVTGDEKGRLFSPSRRHSRKTPTLGNPPRLPSANWPQVRKYLATFNSLQPATECLLSGYKLIPSSYGKPTEHLQPDYEPPTKSAPHTHLHPHLHLHPQQKQSHRQKTASSDSSKAKHKHGEPLKPVSEILKDLGGGENKNGDLAQGIDRRKLFNTYEDLIIEQARLEPVLPPDQTLTEFVARGTLEQAVTLLLVERGLTYFGGKVNSSQLVDVAWPRIAKVLPAFAAVRDYDQRKRQFGAGVINCVVATAIELKRGSE